MTSRNKPNTVGGNEGDLNLQAESPLLLPLISPAKILESARVEIQTQVDEFRGHEHPPHPLHHVNTQLRHHAIITSTSEVSSCPTSEHTSAASWTPEDLISLSHVLPSPELRPSRSSISQRADLVAPGALQNRNVAELSRTTSASTVSSALEASRLHTRRGSTSAPHSPERRPTVSRDFSAQTVVGPASDPHPARPTSVPNFQTQSPVRRRRDGPDHLTYPEQSLFALQSQPCPPPHQPHRLRTRSSHPSQGLAYASSTSQSREYSVMPSGARTAGNTPSQSPGLFTPTSSRSRNAADESENSQYNTPLLHPSHLQAPKETHKLLKDVDPISGRKLVNNYELSRKLGSGQHGTVKLGTNLDTNEEVAVKIVRRFSKKLRLGKAGDPNDMIKKEVAVLKKARHKHVVSLLEVIDDDEFGKVYLILELVERGELVWRKQTDREIARYEMDRIKREKSGHWNPETEMEEIQKFNAAVPSRRAAKARILEEQKRQARAQLRTRSIQKHEYDADANPFWSLEYASELEEEQACDSGTPDDPYYSEEPKAVPMEEGFLGTQGSSAETSTAIDSDTPRAPSRLSVLPSAAKPPSRSGSHLATSVSREGSMHLPDVSDHRSPDVLFQSTLQQIIAGQSQWTPEEEEFMYVPCLTISQALEAFRDTVLGLEYLHYQGIIHRDIKPANLLWTTDHRVKISDFGVSYLGKPIREDDNNEEIAEADTDVLDEAIELAKTVGTPAFYAPELCDPELFDTSKNPERPLITGQIDVWALGVTLYCMIFGRLTFFDVNEFAMYEKIAREEVFIPRLRLRGVVDTSRRLRGVEDTIKASMNIDKRPDDVLEYEEIDDELSDLLRKLLDKDPAKRISLREVKHHPWVVRDISDRSAWEESDPSVQSEGKKIEVSTQEVQEAVVGLNIVGRIKSSLRRFGSVVGRGRDSRKREHSNATNPENAPSTSSSTGSIRSQDGGRRPSLRGDEQIYSALRASREGSEHPLSQSVAASPEMKAAQSYFDSNLITTDNHPADRPTLLERTLSNAESTKTIKAPVPTATQENSSSFGETFFPMTPVQDSNSSSSLGAIFGGTGRRFINSVRSRERGRGRESPSHSSRSSSVGKHSNVLEDPHALPSVAMSSAVASGHVDLPNALRDDLPATAESPSFDSIPSIGYSRPLDTSSAGGFEAHQIDIRQRRSLRHSSNFPFRRRTICSTPSVTNPPSPEDDFTFRGHHYSISHFDDAQFGISSSSDQIASGISEFNSHPSLPSVISGASSFSAIPIEYSHPFNEDKESSHPSTVVGKSPRPTYDVAPDEMPDHLSTLNPAPAEDRVVADDDEAGYNGEGESDSDSDNGIEMGGGRPK